MPLIHFSLLTLLGSLLFASSLQGGLRINEFLAANDGGLQDEDGSSPDWIEIYNGSDAPIQLEGWHLTDDPQNLTRWTFPAINLPPGGFRVVFASGKNRVSASGELHASFQLSRAGEFLALVEPDGATIAHSFSPGYPPQRANVSYGVDQGLETIPLVSPGAEGRFTIPADNSLGTAWNSLEFDDSNWREAVTGIGFGLEGIPGSGGRVVLRVDFNDALAGEIGPANTEPGFDVMTLRSNPSTFNGITVALSAFGGGFLDDRDRNTPVDAPPDFTQDQLYDDFIFVNGQTDGVGLRLQLTGLTPNRDYLLKIWSFDSGSSGDRISDWTETTGPLPKTLVQGYTFDGRNLPLRDGDHTFEVQVRSSPAGELQIESRRNGGTSHGVFLNALQLAELEFESEISTDLESAMKGKNASALLRLPFTVTDPSLFQQLKLRLRYNDGFAAYLNGRRIAEKNAPAFLEWNSTATARLEPGESPAEFVLLNVPGLLVPGENLLAIHGLNLHPDDPDFFLLPELEGLSFGQSFLRYFSPATPGKENGPGYLGLASDPEFSVERGFYESPFDVALTTATFGARIYWSTNGSVPSPAAGALYTAPIPITSTTFLRAAAFLDDHLPSEIQTHTYLFLDQVPRQPAHPPGYPQVWQANFPADYGMDPDIVNHPVYGPALKQDLRSIPTLSIVTEHDALWHPSTGIYVDATRSGVNWERTASVELFDGENRSAFQIDCGLRMQGNASRDNVRTPKHSLRLLFKSSRGPSKLHHEWFPRSPVTRFDNIVLRACFTDAWTTRYSPGDGGSRYRPEDSIYLRDVWMKDTLADMGHLSGRGDFVHLYLNGLYWGLYNPTERLDASFFAEHLGGRKQDWDVIRDFSEVLDGTKLEWNRMMSQANAGLESPAAYEALAELVDLENLIDYMLLHIFAEAEDWPHHNWYAARRRATPHLPATKWIFLAWDQEIVLDQRVRRNLVNVNHNDTPARIYSRLRANPDFRQLFGDRVQKHLFNDGALTPARNVARMQTRAARIEAAITGESARWGDARKFPISPNAGTGRTFTRDEWWRPELQKLYTNMFPFLTFQNLARFRSSGLYPVSDPPEFNQFGGEIPAAFTLVMTHPNAGGTIYYTLDGTDPRLTVTGIAAPSARAYSLPIEFHETTRVRARVLRQGAWSALVEALFRPPGDFSKLRLTEIMYHPPDFQEIAGNEFEFLELQNAGPHALDLSGLVFTEGIRFTFGEGAILGPGQFLVLARNAIHFTTRHPGVPIQGEYSGRLDNAGETITLSHPAQGAILSVSYERTFPWPAAAAGAGFSLQLPAEQSGAAPEHWAAAVPTPGEPYERADSDGDGLPDYWEIQFGTDPLAPDAEADPDQDGMTNWEEFLAGTDPNNPDSHLKLQLLSANNNSITLQFQAMARRGYTVLHLDPGDGAAWHKLVDVESRETTRLELVTDSTEQSEFRIYRLVTPALFEN